MVDGAFRSSAAFELVVLRHGRTAWNENGRFQGHADIPLDATGREQAERLRTLLAGERFTRAIASDLSRAYETVAIALAGAGPVIERDEHWREMRFGAWEGLTWAQIVERNPELADRPAKTPRFYTPEGGESFDELCVRVRSALEDIATHAREGDVVLLGTHAGVLHALLRVALGETDANALRVRFDPATATRLAFGPEGARVVELNRSPEAAAP